MWTDRKYSKRLEKKTDVDTHYCVCVCVFVCVCGKTEWNRRWQKALTKHDKFWHTERLWQIYKLEALHPLRGLFLYKFISKLEESVEGKLHDHRRMNEQNKR